MGYHRFCYVVLLCHYAGHLLTSGEERNGTQERAKMSRPLDFRKPGPGPSHRNQSTDCYRQPRKLGKVSFFMLHENQLGKVSFFMLHDNPFIHGQ